MRLWAAAVGILAALAAYTSGDIIGWLLKGYALFVPGVGRAAPRPRRRPRRHADPKLWTIGAAAGGLGGLIGSLTGITLWTYGGIAAAALFAIFAVRRAAQTRRTAAASPLQPLS